MMLVKHVRGVLVLTAVLLAVGVRTSEATKITRGPKPGIVAEVSYTGIPEPGGILEVTCRFSLPPDAFGAVYLDSLKEDFRKQPTNEDLRQRIDRRDYLYMTTDTNIERVGPEGWSGHIEPGVEYVFTTTIRLKSEYQSQIYFGASTRSGVQTIKGLAFFAGKFPIPIGYVTNVIIDSLGNYWHKHKTVMDSSLEGFTPFDSTRTIPPDTSFDKTGKVLFTIQAVQSGSNKVKLPGTPPKIQLNPAHMIRQKTKSKG